MNIEKFKFNSHIIVMGDLMLDKYWHGDTDRISPESPVPVVNINTVKELPGGAANVALNLASIGLKVTLIGYVGNDEAATTLEKLLTEAGINLLLVKTNFPTITKLRVISRQQQLIRLDFEQLFCKQDNAALSNKLLQVIKNADLLLLSDYNKGTLVEADKYIRIAKQHKVPVFIDPKSSSLQKYRGADLITPNKKEFESIVAERCDTYQDFARHANILREYYCIKSILITLGKDGMLFVSDECPNGMHVTTKAQEVFDVTGAGDTVIAMMALAYTESLNKQDTLNLATAAAAIVVAKMGTATVTMHELVNKISAANTLHQGIYTKDQLLPIIQKLKYQNKRIVMTNGCFDILHLGHLDILKQAKNLGDVLIVAVNSDDSVRRLKGDPRPINSAAMRMAILAELNCVDFVVEFFADTPRKLIVDILPDILVKGGDYKVENIAGSKEVLANGGSVEIIPLLKGYSTTKLVEKIAQ